MHISRWNYRLVNGGGEERNNSQQHKCTAAYAQNTGNLLKGRAFPFLIHRVLIAERLALTAEHWKRSKLYPPEQLNAKEGFLGSASAMCGEVD